MVANPRYGVFCGEIHRIGCAESGGIAGLIVGVLLYFVAGFLNFGADSIGIQTGGGLPN